MTDQTNVCPPPHGGAVARAPSGAPDLDDAGLLADAALWHRLQDGIDKASADRLRREAKVPERFRNIAFDPRGTGKNETPLGGFSRDEWRLIAEYEPVYVELGLGEVNDRLDALFDAQEPVEERLLAARAASRRVAGAILGVLFRELHGDLLRDPGIDEWRAKVARAARDLLARLTEAA